jgi:hypothetical protein
MQRLLFVVVIVGVLSGCGPELVDVDSEVAQDLSLRTRGKKWREPIVDAGPAPVVDAGTIIEEPPPPPSGAAPNDTSPLGTNLADVADWSSEYFFVDAFKQSRPWISGSASGTWDDGRFLDLDANGWVRSLQSGQVARTLMLWDGVQYPAGRFIILWDGDGDLSFFNNTNVVERGTNRIVLDASPSNGGIGINLTRTNATNPLRNLRVIMPGGVCSQDQTAFCTTDSTCGTGNTCQSFESVYATALFHPHFLNSIKRYKVLRFMDWMRTNDSDQVDWSNRPKPTDARYTVHGVPVEIMIALANRLHAEPWFNMPHAATDDYVRNFATVVRNSLASDVRAYVEHSNEVWNGIFPQAQYAAERGRALNLSSDAFQAQLFWHARRSVQMFNIWSTVFGGTTRLVRVMGGFSACTWCSEQSLSFENASAFTDALAIAPYFGGYLGDDGNRSRVASMTLDQMVTELRNVALPNAKTAMVNSASLASRYGVDMIAYEGGQHLVGTGASLNDPAVNSIFDRVNRAAAMKDLYLQHLNDWRASGGQLFVHFQSTSRFSQWGRWGSMEQLTQSRASAPKFDALQSFIETTPRWF